MKRLVSLCIVLVVLLAVSTTAASAQTVNTSIGTGLPPGMKIFVTIGGDGGNCTGSATAVVGRGGTAIVEMDIRCAPSGHPPTPGPNAKCRIMARALDERTNTQYRGQGTLSPTSVPNVYQSRFNLAVVPPRP